MFVRPTGWLGGGRVGALLALLCLVAGCQSAPEKPTREAVRPTRANSVEITPTDEEFVERRATATVSKTARTKSPSAEITEGEVYALPKFSVARKGFRKLGLSVVTNTEVAVGGPIEWMRVGVVLPDTPAARQGLFTGIEILAINNIPVAQLSREDMLHQLFEREAGEPVRLLLYSRQFGPLPRFVTL